MMRGPLMVVDYHPMGTERREPFVGVYRASSEINTYLKLSEPKEHHRWDPKARRLQAKPHGHDVVESVMRRCAVQVREFQASLAPQKEQPRERLEALDKLLGAAFTSLPGTTGGGGSGGNPKYGKALVEFPTGVQRVNGTGGVKLEAVVRIMLGPEERSPQKVTVKPEVVILEDANRTKGRDEDDSLEVKLLDKSKKQLAKGRSPSAKVQLFKDKWIYLNIVTTEYSADWFSELQVTVE